MPDLRPVAEAARLPPVLECPFYGPRFALNHGAPQRGFGRIKQFAPVQPQHLAQRRRRLGSQVNRLGRTLELLGRQAHFAHRGVQTSGDFFGGGLVRHGERVWWLVFTV